MNDPETKKREINALLKASNELKCTDLLIITEHLEKEEMFSNKMTSSPT
ncbi:hypothetical protein HZA97_00015 [Candidatus Woesearchaeota archaeon]|nr:hypothetical protein [Candidatus Woesearchaeota archaeon]